ncbi:hypothetical protein V1291_005516 [Nitrobacteraceae bacterium AZCC 1564]
MNRYFIFAFSLLIPTLASADSTPADTARSWGLLGRWAVDCAAGKTVLYNVEQDGRLIYDNGLNTIVSIDTVTKTKENRIVLTYFWPVDQKVRTLVIEQKDGRIRTVLNRDDANNYTIRDGVLTSSGRQGPWLERCSRDLAA